MPLARHGGACGRIGGMLHCGPWTYAPEHKQLMPALIGHMCGSGDLSGVAVP
ncbi:MAG TPA: hypothetical protein VGK19_17785 [Capsulimonadaceae bacterium]